MSRMTTYYAKKDDPEPFFKDAFERCDAVTTIVHPDADDHISDNEHIAAWLHVKDCIICLRNVTRANFMAGVHTMPLPVFTPPKDGEPDCTIPDCPCGAVREKQAN